MSSTDEKKAGSSSGSDREALLEHPLTSPPPEKRSAETEEALPVCAGAIGVAMTTTDDKANDNDGQPKATGEAVEAKIGAKNESCRVGFTPCGTNAEDARRSAESKGLAKEAVKQKGSIYTKSSSIFSRDLEELMMGVENAEDAPPNLRHLRDALDTSSSTDGDNIISISEKCKLPSEGKNALPDTFMPTEDPYHADGDRTPDELPSQPSRGSTPVTSAVQPSRRVVTRVEEAPLVSKYNFSFPRERWGESVGNTLLAEDSDNHSSSSHSDHSPLKQHKSPSTAPTLTDVPIDTLMSSGTDDLRGTETASAMSFPLGNASVAESKSRSTPFSEKHWEKLSDNAQGRRKSSVDDDGASEPVRDTMEGIEDEWRKSNSNNAKEAVPSVREYAERIYSFKNKRSFTILLILIPFMLVTIFIPISMYWSARTVAESIVENSLREVNHNMIREIIAFVDYVALTPAVMLRLMAANLGVSTLNQTRTPFSLPSREQMMKMFCTAVMRSSMQRFPAMIAYVSQDPNTEMALCYHHHSTSSLFTLLPQPNTTSPPLYSDLYRVDPFTLTPQTAEPYYRMKRARSSRELMYITGFTQHLKRWRKEASRDSGAVRNVTLSKKVVPFAVYSFAFPFYEPGKDTLSLLVAMTHSRDALMHIRRTDNNLAFKKSRVMLISIGTFHNVSTMGVPEEEDTEEEQKDMYLVACNWDLCKEKENPLWFLSEDEKESTNPHIKDIEDPLAKAALQQINFSLLAVTHGWTQMEREGESFFPKFKVHFAEVPEGKFTQYKQFSFEGETVAVNVLILNSSAGSSFLLVLATPVSIVHKKRSNTNIFVGFAAISIVLVILGVRSIIMRYLHQPLVDICTQLEKAADFCETKSASSSINKGFASEGKSNDSRLKALFPLPPWLHQVFRWRIVLTEIDEVKNECDVLKKRMDEVRQYLPDEIFPGVANSSQKPSSITKEVSSETDVSNSESSTDHEDEKIGRDAYSLGQLVHFERESAVEKTVNLKNVHGTKDVDLEKGDAEKSHVDHTGLTSEWLKSIHYMSTSAKKDPLSAHTNTNTNRGEVTNALSFARRPKALKLRKTQVQVSDIPAKRPDGDGKEKHFATGPEALSTPCFASGANSMEEPATESAKSPTSRQEDSSSGQSAENATATTLKSFSAFKLGIQEDYATEIPRLAQSFGNAEQPDSPLLSMEKKEVANEQPSATMTKSTFKYSKCFCTVASLSINFDREHTPLKYVPFIEKLITDTAFKYEGSIDIFGAEIFYISFGSRRHMKDHALAATRFAIEVIERLTFDMLKYVTMVVDAGVYFTSIIGLPERKGFVAWGRPSAQLLREAQCLHGFHLFITEPTVLLLRNKFRLLPVDVCNMHEEPGAPCIPLYVLYTGSVKKKSWQSFSAAYMRFFKKVVDREFEQASHIVGCIYGSKYFPLFGLRFGLMSAMRVLLETPLSPSVTAEEKLRQLNEISVSYAQYLKDANIASCPMGFYLPSYVRLNVNSKGNNMLDMGTINYQLRFASPEQEEFLQSMAASSSAWARPEYEEPYHSETEEDSFITTVSNSLSSENLLSMVAYVSKKEEPLDPPVAVGGPQSNLTGWMKKKHHREVEALDLDTVPKSIPRFIEDYCQNVWRRSCSPVFDFKNPVFLCISQNGTLASMQVYDLPIRPDFWSTSLSSARMVRAPSRAKDEAASDGLSNSTAEASDATRLQASFESTYARYFSNFTHENLVQYISVAVIPRSSLVCIISEYVPGGTLEQNAQSYTRRLPLAAIKQYSISIIRALEYLHVKRHIVHGRINPYNILVGVDGYCKLKGMIYLFDWVWQTPTSPCALLKNMASYNAPEVNAGASRTPASDIYSFGLVLLGMLTCSTPWEWVTGITPPQSMTETMKDDALFLKAYEANQLKLRTYDGLSCLSSTSGSSCPTVEEEGKGRDAARDNADEPLPAASPCALDKALHKVLQRSLASNPEDRHIASSLLRILSKAA